MNTDTGTTQERLRQLFGSYKAEWLRNQMFSLFTEPAYFPELVTNRPCILIGGRGTGKTTVLRCLSYEGQFIIRGQDPSAVPSFEYYGIYYRVNTNRVSAFKGSELSEERWARLFAHYFNLALTSELSQFLNWYQLHVPQSTPLPADTCRLIAESLNLSPVETTADIAKEVKKSLVAFEAYINNVLDAPSPPLSLQGAPLDILFEGLNQLPQFSSKLFFVLVDEFENFEDYQQQVLNTLLKHSSPRYTFKIGVRELGWRRRSTLNTNEQLISPADYVRIDICEKLKHRFADFARDVCNQRLAMLRDGTEAPVSDISLQLQSLTEEEEARVLDEDIGHLTRARSDLINAIPQDQRDVAESLSDFELYFLSEWAKGHSHSVRQVWEEYRSSPGTWSQRFGNYKHALLYTIRKGRRGIRKYYCGWSVFTQLAGTNIRYLLELVDQSLLLHLEDKDLSSKINPRVQTLAAQAVGKKNLSELEGLSVHGAQLTKLLLALGRIFQEMAADISAHAPEVNQFHLPEVPVPAIIETAVDSLLTSAVMHLALVRSLGNKPTDQAETRDYDYMVHPLFAPFFVFSYRRKRKCLITAQQLLGLVKEPRKTIRDVLEAQHRTLQDTLPEQLLLFESFYHGGS